MAQDTRKITIEILNTTRTIGDSEGYKNDKINDLIQPMNNATKKKEKSLFGKAYLVLQAYNTVKNLAQSSTEMSINRYFNMSENYLAENTFNNVKQSLNKAAGFASSVIAGGYVAGGIGAAIGAGAFVVNEWMSFNNTLSGYYSSLNASNFGTQFSNTRASLYNNGRGTEN